MAKKAARKRYGRRADGQTQTSISLSEEVFIAARAAAQARGITLSKLIEEALSKVGGSKAGGSKPAAKAAKKAAPAARKGAKK